MYKWGKKKQARDRYDQFLKKKYQWGIQAIKRCSTIIKSMQIKTRCCFAYQMGKNRATILEIVENTDSQRRHQDTHTGRFPEV